MQRIADMDNPTDTTEHRQVKSRERVRDHGEVFTAEREVKAMCDLVRDECEKIGARFLEPACGDGNFLAEILRRKLSAAKGSPRLATEAVSSLYGIEILPDNAAECRERLFGIWRDYIADGERDETAERAVRFILSLNIVCGNALSMRRMDSEGRETSEPIIFAEWTWTPGSDAVARRDFRFDSLLRNEAEPLFADVEPPPVKTWPPVDWRTLGLPETLEVEDG